MHICWLPPAGLDTPIYRQSVNYLRREGQAPPPVSSAANVAAAALELAVRPRRSRRVGLGNLIAEFGYLFTPAVYDALVTPMFRTVIMKRRSSVPPHPGNLFVPPPDEMHRIRG